MISVMFDLATKLASLSDISFLLIVESQGKTKFAGTRHLTDAYLMSNLCQFVDSDGRDIEMQFEPSPLPKVVLTHKTGYKSGNPGFKRRYADSIQSFEEVDSGGYVDKRLRFTRPGDAILIEGGDAALTAVRPDPSININNSVINCNSEACTQSSAVSSLNGANSPTSPLNNNFSVAKGNLVSLFAEHDREGFDDGVGGSGDDVVVKEEVDVILSTNGQILQDEETSSVILSDSNPHLPAAPQQQLLLSRDFEWDVKEFLENSEKLKFITKIETASVVLDKESTEFKLLHSLIYELSKTAATFCPFVEASDPRTSQFFSNVFDTFWSYVPFLQQLHVEGVLPGNKATSKYKNLKSLLRWKMQKNFGVLMKKYNVRCRT